MKRLISILLALLVITGCFCMSGCSSSGLYKFSSITIQDGSKLEVGDKYGFATLDEDYYTIELKSDGTCVRRILGIAEHGTYENSFFTITLRFIATYDIIKGRAYLGKLIIEDDETIIVLVKS